jgi:hypothetical protein
MNSPHKVVEMFEENVAEYAGAPYAVACDNCTNAIKMACQFYDVKEVTIPKRTYLSVPQSIIQAGGKVKFEDLKWKPSFLGYNSYITPEWAAWGMMMLSVYPKHAEDQIEEPDYRDLTTFNIFKDE